MFEVESCVRGFNVHGASWSPYVGEILHCVREFGNREDLYAVAVQSSLNSTVDHVPQKILAFACYFYVMVEESPALSLVKGEGVRIYPRVD
jgi:hypothetical protein